MEKGKPPNVVPFVDIWCHVVHGNLSGVGISFSSFRVVLITFGPWTSILVDLEGYAHLVDFEFPAVVRGMKFVTQEGGYITTLTAPEILEGADMATPEADVFSFAMVAMEVGLRPGGG